RGPRVLGHLPYPGRCGGGAAGSGHRRQVSSGRLIGGGCVPAVGWLGGGVDVGRVGVGQGQVVDLSGQVADLAGTVAAADDDGGDVAGQVTAGPQGGQRVVGSFGRAEAGEPGGVTADLLMQGTQVIVGGGGEVGGDLEREGVLR